MSDIELQTVMGQEKFLIQTANRPFLLKLLLPFLFEDSVLTIREVNGVNVEQLLIKQNRQLAVLPGLVKLSLTCAASKNGKRGHFEQKIEVNARVGFKYNISCRFASKVNNVFRVSEFKLVE